MSSELPVHQENPDHREGMDSTIDSGVFQRLVHDSARKQTSGKASYVDDMPEPYGLLHIYVAMSEVAHADLVRLDLAAVRKAAGVASVLAAADVPGDNDFGHAHCGDDRVFAEGKVEFAGQALFCVAADSIESAHDAAKLAVVDYAERPAVITIDDAMRAGSFLGEPLRLTKGNADRALAAAPHRLQGSITTGAQEHFYLEPQVSMAIPGEDGDVHIYCATQDTTAVQHLVARVLGKSANRVTVEVRRMGGGFGGKETAPTQFAAIAALVATKTGRPAKICLDRDADMLMTGKRHEFRFDYDVGFDGQGRLAGGDFKVAARCGYSLDQSIPVLQRGIYHLDNAYFLGDVTITGYPCKTNTCSSGAFRGFGSPQPTVAIERVMDEIALYLGLEPLAVRKANIYDSSDRNVTHYDWKIEDNILPRILEELEASSDYRRRRQAVKDFNGENPWIKKGIALMPLKYGVGFTARFLNQAGALIHVYQDGSVHLNHGGTEMGQGLFVKVAQIVAEELQVDITRIKISSTTTEKVPNTSPTAASTGTDLNGAAAQIAARTIKGRLMDFAAEHYNVSKEYINFHGGLVTIGNRDITFEELVGEAYLGLVSLSATGFYKNPSIKVDPVTLKGRPYHYNAYGGAVVEVAIDTLTGESKVLRIDILHDAGRSLNPAIDMGQLEGGFLQGIGWLTCEELYWDDAGRLKTHAPSTYKIPACSDRPADMRMQLVDWSENHEDVVFRSKAIGEPPFNLAVSTFNAITDAVASVADYRLCPRLDTPATPERILMAVEEIRDRLSGLER